MIKEGVYRQRIAIAILLLMPLFYSCFPVNSVHQLADDKILLQDTVVTDRDGNIYTIRTLGDGNLWMTSNLNVKIPNSFCFNDNPDSCLKYGRLYTWESAQDVCLLLGKGWVLPSRDDWINLIKASSGDPIDSGINRKKAFQQLLSGKFGAKLGGGRKADGSFARLNAHGFYWCSTETSDSTAWFANFGKGSLSLYFQNDGDKPSAFSIRCVKITGGSK